MSGTPEPLRVEESLPAVAALPAAGARGEVWRVMSVVLALAAVLVPLALTRAYDPDELEHLHASWCVAHGSVPYRDFYEHHPPLFYYLLAPLHDKADPMRALFRGRVLMVAATLATAALAASTLRLLVPPAHLRAATSALAGLMLLSVTFVQKGIEIRPDVPAAFLLLLGLRWSLPARPWSWRRAAAAAGTLALATLFTPKAAAPVACLWAAFLIDATWQGRSLPARIARFLVAIPLAVAAAWVAVAAAMAVVGAAGEYWHGAVLVPLRERGLGGAAHPWWSVAAGDLPAWLAGAAGAAVILGSRRPCGPLPIAVALLLVSTPIIGASYPQYFFLWLSWMALGGVAGIADVAETHRTAVVRAFLIGGAAAAVALVIRAARKGDGGAFSNIAAYYTPDDVAFWAAVPAVVAALGLAATVRRPITTAALFTALLATGGYGLARQMDAAVRTDTDQRTAIATVNALVGVDREKVLDGFSGLGVFRPHASYWWWVNGFSRRHVPPEEWSRLRQALENGQIREVLVDRELKAAFPGLMPLLNRRFTPRGLAGVDVTLWLNERPPPPPPPEQLGPRQPDPPEVPRPEPPRRNRRRGRPPLMAAGDVIHCPAGWFPVQKSTRV